MKKTMLGHIASAGMVVMTNFLFVAPTMAAGTVYVNAADGTSDASGCGTMANPCNTIQTGVNNAATGATIKVAAGNYTEVVNVNKTVKLLGAQYNKDPQNRNGAESTVLGFNLAANGIELNGFRVYGNTAGPGIETSNLFSGYLVQRNIVENNVFGIYFNASGASKSVVTRNLIRNNNQPGAASGNGLYSDQGLSNAQVDHNTFTGANSNGSVTLVGGQNVQLDHNTLTGENNGFYIINSVNTEADHNTLSNFDSWGNGVQLDGNNSNVRVDHNTITGAPWSGINIKASYGANNGLVVDHNTVTGAKDAGIVVGDTAMTNGKIEYNTLNNNGDTLADDGTFDDGLLIKAGNANILINHNRMSGNIGHDAHDVTTGGGTAGTANTWDRNNCTTSSPAGLCS